MAEIKVGDKVRVRSWEEMLRIPGVCSSDSDLYLDGDCFIDGMKQLSGQIFEVVCFDRDNPRRFDLKEAPEYYFTEWMVEVICSEVPEENDSVKDNEILDLKCQLTQARALYDMAASRNNHLSAESDKWFKLFMQSHKQAEVFKYQLLVAGIKPRTLEPAQIIPETKEQT